MKILLISATEAEIAPLIHQMPELAVNHDIQYIITGVGMPATVYHLTKQLSIDKYDMVIQAGIAGAFNRDISLGSVVYVQSDRYGDMGADDNSTFIDIYDMGLAGTDVSPFSGGALQNPYTPAELGIDLHTVHSLTVNTTSGSKAGIERLQEKYNCDIESMEGAAFHYVCLMEGVKFMQVRGISNYVEPRNKANWQMKQAINALNTFITGYLQNN